MARRNEVTLALAGRVCGDGRCFRFLLSTVLLMGYLAMWYQESSKSTESLWRPTRSQVLGLLWPCKRCTLLQPSRRTVCVETPSFEQVTSILVALVDVELLFGCQAVFGARRVLHRV